MTRGGVLCLLLCAVVLPLYAGATIVDSPLPKTAGAQPGDLRTGPDGHTWFLDLTSGALARVNDDGSVTAYFPPRGATSFATGVDGALWYLNAVGGLGRFDVNTREFSDPSSGGGFYPGTTKMILGPDGNFWKIGSGGGVTRITPSRTYTFFATGLYASDVVAGPDGNLWFTEHDVRRIGRLTTLGVVTEFAIPGASAYPDDIAAGADGNLWFTADDGVLRRITPAGAITEFPISRSAAQIAWGPDGNIWQAAGNTILRTTPSGQFLNAYTVSQNANIRDLAAGADGNLWATGYGNATLIRIAPGGGVTELPARVRGGDPYRIAAGPDGRMWFTEKETNRVGVMSLTGAVTEYAIAEPNTLPTEIVAGSDGALWFVESAVDKIGRITTGGVMTHYTLPAGSSVTDLTSGSDGALWITAQATNQIIRLSTGGALTSYPLPAGRTSPSAIATGADGKVWFGLNGSIGRFGTSGDYAEFALDTSGSPITDMSFDAASGKIYVVQPFRVRTIDTAGTIADAGGNVGMQLIAAANGVLWSTTATEIVRTVPDVSTERYTRTSASPRYAGLAIGADGNIWVAAQGLSSLAKVMTRFEAVSFSSCYTPPTFSGTVARIRDVAPPASALGYTAVIDWGDGSPAQGGTLVADGDWFDVNATHTFATDGLHVVTVTLADRDAPDDTVTLRATVGIEPPVTPVITFQQFCSNAPVIATVTDAGPGAFYHWTVPGTVLEQTGNRIKFSTYEALNVSVVIDKSGWCTSVSASATGSFGNCKVPHVTMTANGSATAGSNTSVTVTVKDQYDTVLPTYTGTVHFTADDVTAVLPADYTFTGADSGVHTFTNVRFTSIGTKTVTVTDLADSSSTASTNITVEPGPAASIAFPGSTPARAGVVYAITLTARDSYGYIAKSYAGTVHFTSNDAEAALPANYTFVPADSGVHTFMIKLLAKGQASVTATDVANASLTYTRTIDILPSPLYPDFNGDGKADLLWRNTATGTNVLWYMDGANYLSGAETYGVTDQHWKVAAAADFNGNGIADIVWRNSATGEITIWFMNGATLVSGNTLPSVSDPQWQIEAAADMNNDGYTDLVWHNHTTGLVTAWLMNGTSIIRSADMEYASEPANWHIAGAADFDGDGDNDLFFRNSANGRNVIWHMQAMHIASGEELPSEPDANWKVVAAGDYTRDGNADLVWRNLANGMNVIWRMNGSTLVSGIELPRLNDPNWRIVGPK